MCRSKGRQMEYPVGQGSSETKIRRAGDCEKIWDGEMRAIVVGCGPSLSCMLLPLRTSTMQMALITKQVSCYQPVFVTDIHKMCVQRDSLNFYNLLYRKMVSKTKLGFHVIVFLLKSQPTKWRPALCRPPIGNMVIPGTNHTVSFESRQTYPMSLCPQAM